MSFVPPELTGLITATEVESAIKRLHLGKAPGSDGLTADFYKHYSEFLVDVLVDVFNEIYESKDLTATQKIAIIVLIFKKGDTTLVGNYRPILLMNCDYKILVYILVLRLESTLPLLIHPNQTAYMKGHFIGTNIQSVQNFISDSAAKNSAVLFLDFHKAFDSVNHLFMFTLLTIIGLPPEFVLWATILYSNSSSMVRHQNWLTTPFDMSRGVYQGCPLSCHLFNLVGQVLIYSLRDHGYFEWWTFLGDPCSLYADDTTIFLHNLSQLAKVIQHIHWVGTFTGLHLNIDKTITFNSEIVGERILAGVSTRNTPVKYLGAFLGLGDLTKLNFEQPLRKAHGIMNKWNNRHLTLDGCILIFKTFLFSVFTHMLNSIFLTVSQINVIQKLVSDFVWQGRNKI